LFFLCDEQNKNDERQATQGGNLADAVVRDSRLTAVGVLRKNLNEAIARGLPGLCSVSWRGDVARVAWLF